MDDMYFGLKWMFVGSLVIGIYFNGMNVLADRLSDVYFSSITLIYSALLMASNMCILEILMHYNHSGVVDINTLLFFITMSAFLVYALRSQLFVTDEQWLKRMISHHSTAITTSRKIAERTTNNKVMKLATDIVVNQKNEIETITG
jgi:hypothetical protein